MLRSKCWGRWFDCTSEAYGAWRKGKPYSSSALKVMYGAYLTKQPSALEGLIFLKNGNTPFLKCPKMSAFRETCLSSWTTLGQLLKRRSIYRANSVVGSHICLCSSCPLRRSRRFSKKATRGLETVAI